MTSDSFLRELGLIIGMLMLVNVSACSGEESRKVSMVVAAHGSSECPAPEEVAPQIREQCADLVSVDGEGAFEDGFCTYPATVGENCAAVDGP